MIIALFMITIEGHKLDALVEITLKDDEREDPLITEDALEMPGLLTGEECRTIKDLTQKICAIIKDRLAKKDIELFDIKLKFGRIDESGQIVLIDEISSGNMRAYKNGQRVEPLDLKRMLLDGPID